MATAATVAAAVLPVVGVSGVSVAAPLALGDGVEAFLDRQLDKFPLPGDYPAGFDQARLIQSFDLAPPEFLSGEDPLRHQAYIYDSALAAVYYTGRGDLARAQQLADGIRLVQALDPFGDGRVRTAYYANDLQNPGNTQASIDGGNAASGNNAWAGIALTRFYAAAGEAGFLAPSERQVYLDAARGIGDWLLNHTRQPITGSDPLGGFSLGFDAADAPIFNTDVRSVENNLDVYAFGLNLAALDPANESKWLDMAGHAQHFVQAMFDEANGKYWIGTKDGAAPGSPVVNPTPVPTDTQAWTALAGVDDSARVGRALDWMLDPTQGTVTEDTVAGAGGGDVTLAGTLFSDTGEHIHSEVSAAAAMALLLMGRPLDVAPIAAGLESIRLDLPGSDPDGIGVLATPWPDGGRTEAFFGDPDIRYLRHVASSVWAGFLGAYSSGEVTANPFVPVPEPGAVGLLAGAWGVAVVGRRRGWSGGGDFIDRPGSPPAGV